jgi:hypothetical protein
VKVAPEDGLTYHGVGAGVARTKVTSPVVTGIKKSFQNTQLSKANLRNHVRGGGRGRSAAMDHRVSPGFEADQDERNNGEHELKPLGTFLTQAELASPPPRCRAGS